MDVQVGPDAQVNDASPSTPGSACADQPDGTVIITGDFAECVFDDSCVESGNKVRTDRVCMAGQLTAVEVTEACERETDELIVTEGVAGTCEYTDRCAEAGIQSRTDRVCVDGIATDRVVEQACNRETDGVVVSEGAFGACAYADPCAESALRSRTDRVCVDGIATENQVTEMCQRDTDGTVLSEGMFAACAYGGPCAQRADRSRTDRVCVDGLATDVTVTEVCQRDTDGVVVAAGAFNACTYADDCTEDGTQARTDRICENGQLVDSVVSQACRRETEGMVVSVGRFEACIYEDACTLNGSQTRTDQVCEGGLTVERRVSEACARDTHGFVISEGTFGACQFDDACTESGARNRTDRVCANGVITDRLVPEACTRETDDLVLEEGSFGDCRFLDECIESGTQSRVDRVCTNGVVTDRPVSAECTRETDGRVLEEGVFSACTYLDDCAETGRQRRTDRVCQGGLIADTVVDGECQRETDGLLLSEGMFGACGYDTQCAVSGTKERTDQRCQDGVAIPDVVQSQEGCERDPVPGWSDCGDVGCLDVRANLQNCGGCGIVCPAHSVCTDGTCECVGNRQGPGCDACLPNFAGPDCEDCAENFQGVDCSACRPGFVGPQCDQVAELDYEDYERRAGVAFTPVPAAIPIPMAACAAKENQRVFDGRQVAVDCMIPEDTCARIADGAEVVCAGGMAVDGVLWITSSSVDAETLLIADFIEVSDIGQFHVTGETVEQPYAQRAEIFLRHEYCGKPEDGFDADFAAANVDDCRRKGKFQSLAGVVKMAGQPKTTWSLLTHDSRDTHAIEANLIKVDHCAGWRPGDVLSVAATGGNEETFQGVRNWCTCEADADCPAAMRCEARACVHDGAGGGEGPNCISKANSKSEKRTIQTVTEYADNTCDVVLTAALEMNHRGNALGVASPFLRIQAEVVNHSRSVVITGGYQSDAADPSSRVATRYDYSNDGMSAHTYGDNPDQSPCRTCKFADDPSAGAHDLCTDPAACQVYDAEGENIQLCGQDCSPIGMQGITTVQMHGGVMQMSHVAVEKCGRRELAEYCLHFHHIGDVKHAVSSGAVSHESYFVGNAVQEGINKGITIHGTHHALVQGNVVHNQQGPGIYIEDGNELYNVVEENVVMCSELQSNSTLCKLKNARNRPETTDSDWNEVSGLYFLAPMNHTIGNRVFGYDNAMYVNRNTSGQTGLGMARGKLCISAFPFGYTVGNVFHNNAGFGWYANTAFPMDLINLGGLEVSNDGENMKGTVVDWTTCLPFSLTGDDHSFNIKIQKHVEYFNDFSAGVYSVGDVTLEDYTTYGGNKGLYWKTYRRGMNSDPLCVNCTFARTTIEGPGGSALVEFRDSDFYRSHEAYQVNHHCSLDGGTGGLCASHYDFRSSRFYEWSHAEQRYLDGGPYFYSGVTPTTTLIYTPNNKVLTHVTQNVAFDIENEPRCQDSTPYAGEGWHECDNTGGDAQAHSLELRIVRIYSPDRGQLTVTNHSEGDQTYTVPWTNHGPQSGGASAYGVLPNCQGNDCPNYMRVSGYVFSVPAGAEISLSFETVLGADEVLADLFTLEYSDQQMLPRTEITIRGVEGTGMMDSAEPCTIASDHGRAFITPFGPVHGAAGAWYNECGHAWDLNYSMQDLIDRSYQGDNHDHGGGDNGGGDNGGGDQPEVDLLAEPPTPSPWTQRVHPDPELVISMYTSVPGHADAFSNDPSCRGQSACSWPGWGAQEGVCEACNITWFPGWSPQRAFAFDYQLGEEAGQQESDRILRVEMAPNWFSLFEFPPGDTLDLTDYDVLHFEVWSPGVTNLAVKARDYGPNRVWDAALDDIERTKAVAFDDNLIPNQWSVIEINLDELFAPDAPRNLGQMLIVDIGPNLPGMPLFFSNMYFYRRP